MLNRTGKSKLKKLFAVIMTLTMVFSMTFQALAAQGSNPLTFLGAYLTTTNHLTESDLSLQTSSIGSIIDTSVVPTINNDTVHSGWQTIDINIDKNIVSEAIYNGETVYAHNQGCITLKDVSANSNVPISLYRLGDGSPTDLYKNHIYFDVNLISGHKYEIAIDTSLIANNGLTLGQNTIYTGVNPILTQFTVANDAPVISSAETSTDGSKVIMAFNKAMTDPTGKQGQFTVHVGSSTDAVTAAALNASDPSKIELSLTTPVLNGDTVTVDYTAGTVTAADTRALMSFTNKSVTNNVLDPNAPKAVLSTATAAAGASFKINITNAKDASKNLLAGSIGVVVTNATTGDLFNGNASFVAGSSTITIPATATTGMTTAGNYTLNLSIAGVATPMTVPVTITGANTANSANSTAVIDKPLSPGNTSTITVTLKDIYNNLMANKVIADNVKIATNVIITNNYPAVEIYMVNGQSMTSSGSDSKAVTTDANGQYQVKVSLPENIDPSDGISVQLVPRGTTTGIGNIFSFKSYIAMPVVSSAFTSNANHITLNMDSALLGTLGDSKAFTITGAKSNPNVKSVAVSGTHVILTLDAAIAYEETIKVSYKNTGSNNLTNGAEVADFTDQSVINTVPAVPSNPVLISTTTNTTGSLITATFDKDMATLPTALSGFSVAVDGNNDVVNAVALNTDNSKVELLLATAIKNGQKVTISYNPGTVKALDGGVLASFQEQTVDNNVLNDGYITTLTGAANVNVTVPADTGDNGLAFNALFKNLSYTTVDSMGNIYFVDSSSYKVREIANITHTQFGINMAAGNIYTVAGIGGNSGGYSGDGGPAINAKLCNWVHGITVDANGNLYIADWNNNRIREVANTDHDQFGYVGATGMKAGYIYTVAGCGTPAYTTTASEEGVTATNAHINTPYDVAVDTAGNLYIADTGNNRVRKVDVSGIITTIAGTGTNTYNVDRGLATTVNLAVQAISLDGSGNLYIADTTNKRVLKLDASNNITTIIGNMTRTDAGLTPTTMGINISGMTSDAAGNIYISEGNWGRVDKIGTDGSITTLAGFGYIYPIIQVLPFNGDNIPATTALLGSATDVAIDNWGNMYVSDQQHKRIYFVKNPQAVSVAPPVVNSAVTLDQTHIQLNMSRALLGTIGDPQAFTVSGYTVTAVEISSTDPTKVTLTLNSEIAYKESLNVGYTKTGIGNLTAVANFSNQTVINNIPAVAPNVTADDAANKITGIDSTMEYSIDNGNWIKYVTNPDLSGDHTVYVRVAADAVTGTPAGAEKILEFTTNPPAPVAPSVTANDAANKIVGINSTMEYSIDNGSWISYNTDPDLTGVHTVYVRVAYDAATGTPAGAVTTLKFTTIPTTSSIINVAPIVTNDPTATKANVVVTENQLLKDGTNVISPIVPSTATSVSTSISVGSIKGGVGTEKVQATVGGNDITVSLPFDAVDLSLINDSTAKFVLSQTVSTDSTAASMLAAAPSGDKTIGKVFSFNLDVAGTPVHNFANGKAANISIKLTADDIKGLDTSKLSAFYYDEAAAKWIEVGGSYDPNTMVFKFNTTHFTSFTVMQKPIASEVVATPVTPVAVVSTLPKTGSPIDFFTLIFAGVSLIAAGAFLALKKRKDNI